MSTFQRTESIVRTSVTYAIIVAMIVMGVLSMLVGRSQSSRTWTQYRGTVVAYYDRTGCVVQCEDGSIRSLCWIRPNIGSKVHFAKSSDGVTHLYSIDK